MGLDIESSYRRFGSMVLRRCRRLLRDEEQAVDAMHDVFVELLRRERTLDDRAPSSLLFQVATNVCLNRLRSGRRRPLPAPDPDGDLLERIAAAGDDEGRSVARGVLERAFGATPTSTRTIAVLHLLDGLTLEEVAAEVGLSVSGVRKRLRALRDRVHELEGVV